jgi:hypothetical protein
LGLHKVTACEQLKITLQHTQAEKSRQQSGTPAPKALPLVFKKPTAAKKAESFSKRQKLPNESTLKLYILRSCCPEEEPHSQYKLIVY